MRRIKKIGKGIVKVFCLAIIASALSGFLGEIRANAAAVAWPDSILSNGNVVMQKEGTDKVEIFAQDFALIKSRIDALAEEVN